jgi:hypothetical protein
MRRMGAITLKESYPVEAGDFSTAGEASGHRAQGGRGGL